MANLADSGGGIFCGGSLIAPTVVLAAAHCAGVSKVYIGRYNVDSNTEVFETFNVVTELIHPSFNGGSMVYDFMLLRLSSSSSRSPVRIDSAQGATLSSGQALEVMGWGTTSSSGSTSSVLMEVSIGYVTNAVCQAAYGAGEITDTMMCAASAGKDSCQGDSGGPLIIKGASAAADVQVGVVSWGSGCADPAYPGVYSRIKMARAWIESTLSSWGSALPCP
jgi:trypsin